jgi:hypothetical protein
VETSDEAAARVRERTAGLELPPPSTVIQRDYRSATTRLAAVSEWGRSSLPAAATGGGGQVRLVQWNIERGYQLQAIVHQLRHLDADVIALQEIDVGCVHSHHAPRRVVG